MVIDEILVIVLNNGVGVFFGYLLYTMANTTIKENSTAIKELVEYLKQRKE